MEDDMSDPTDRDDRPEPTESNHVPKDDSRTGEDQAAINREDESPA